MYFTCIAWGGDPPESIMLSVLVNSFKVSED